MILRNKRDIPIEFYMWTELYFKTIKNHLNDGPPNIMALLNKIQILKSENVINWNDYSKLYDTRDNMKLKSSNKSTIKHNTFQVDKYINLLFKNLINLYPSIILISIKFTGVTKTLQTKTNCQVQLMAQ